MLGNQTNLNRIKKLQVLGIILAISCSHALAKRGKWKVLFNGKSTEAWRGFRQSSLPGDVWKVENKSLTTIVGHQSIDVVTKEKYGDFELRLEWKIAPGGNSGIMYRVSYDFDETWKTGPEMQVLDDDKHRDGQNPKTSAGSLYGLIAPVNKSLKPVGRWNKVRIVVNKGHVEHWLNGRKVVEYDLLGPQLSPLIAASKFKDFPRFCRNDEGYIALQHHGDRVWYRKIRIRSLQF
jgi:hypothetical protein